MRSGFSTLTLAYWIDSLVRVSRRDSRSHFGKIARRPLKLLYSFSAWLPIRRPGASKQTIPVKKLHFASCIRILSNTPELAADSLWSTKPLPIQLEAQISYTNDYSSTTFFSTISSLLTLFSKFFSSFLRSTCSLSVSHKYLALEEVYLPFRAAIPNNPTLR